MVNSLLATLRASQDVWDRARSGSGDIGAIVSIPMSVMQYRPSSVHQVGLERGSSFTESETKDRTRMVPADLGSDIAPAKTSVLRDSDCVSDYINAMIWPLTNATNPR